MITFFLGMLATVALYGLCFFIAYMLNSNWLRYENHLNDYDKFVDEPLRIFLAILFVLLIAGAIRVLFMLGWYVIQLIF